MSDIAIMKLEHIVKSPNTLSGSARIAGRRIPVWQIVNLYYHLNASVDEIVASYDLTPAQVFAALAYYHDHEEEIDAEIRETISLVPAEVQERMAREDREKALAQWREKFDTDPTQEMTVSEIADTYGVAPQSIREACAKGWVQARKSGSVWLIERFLAYRRWGQPPPR